MTKVYRILTPMVMVLLIVAVIAACGGGSHSNTPGGSGGGSGSPKTITKQLLNLNPVHLLSVSKKTVTQASAFNWNLVESAYAQAPATPTIGFNNLSGFCGTLPNPPVSVAAVVPFGLGSFTDGRCNLPDTDDGVPVPENGFLGNWKCEARGTRTNAQSGRCEFYVNNQLVHTLTMGQSNSIEDLVTIKPVLKGDKVKVRYWQQPGDQEFNLKVGIGFGN